MKPWQRLLISQLFLVSIVLNLCGAIRHDDYSVRMVAPLIGQILWYAGLVLPFAGGTRIEKIAAWVVGGGAWLVLSAALCKGFDIESLSVSLAIFLSVPALVLLISGGYGLVRLRR